MRQGIRGVAASVAALRVLLGVVAVGRPALAARPWVGPVDGIPAVVVLGRATGARDIALGAGALLAVARDDTGAVRDWTAAGAFCDLLDLVSTLAAWGRLPATRVIVAAAAGGAAAIGAVSVAAARGVER